MSREFIDPALYLFDDVNRPQETRPNHLVSVWDVATCNIWALNDLAGSPKDKRPANEKYLRSVVGALKYGSANGLVDLYSDRVAKHHMFVDEKAKMLGEVHVMLPHNDGTFQATMLIPIHYQLMKELHSQLPTEMARYLGLCIYYLNETPHSPYYGKIKNGGVMYFPYAGGNMNTTTRRKSYNYPWSKVTKNAIEVYRDSWISDLESGRVFVGTVAHRETCNHCPYSSSCSWKPAFVAASEPDAPQVSMFDSEETDVAIDFR